MKLARLSRRLWRRMIAWRNQHINVQELRKAILRETSWFGCPFNPLSRDDSDVCFAWLSETIKNCETFLSTKRLQHWKHKIQSNEQEIWKWLRRDKQVEPVQHVLDPEGSPLDGEDLFRAIEQFWRRHWATTPPDPDGGIPDSHDARQNPPQLPPITGWDLRNMALQKQKKPPGLTVGNVTRSRLCLYLCLISSLTISIK